MTPTTGTTGTTDAFSFVHEGRTFTCCVEGSSASARGSWWWFAVSGELHSRHAPFPAAATDTQDDVRERIVAYYDALLARRSAPYQSPWQVRHRARTQQASGDAPPATG